MKREIQHIIDDYINLSDRRDLINETKIIINEDSNVIIELLENLYETKLEKEYKRNQLRDSFLPYLFLLNENKMISLSFQIVKKFNSKLDIKELASKIVYYSSGDSVFDQVVKTSKDQDLESFNNLLLGELILRRKLPNFEFDQDFITFDQKWVGINLDPIEQDLNLRSGNGGFGYNFGLSFEPTNKYKCHGFERLILKKNADSKLNELASIIAKKYISVIEFGDILYIDKSLIDIKSEIICQLNYTNTQITEVEIAFRMLDKTKVFNNLFCMSVLGGAYERGEFHATSRINSWKVISSLMQIDYRKYNKNEISNFMDGFEWTEFSCDNGWFINEIIDLGIIGINSDRTKYAIIAITDTD